MPVVKADALAGEEMTVWTWVKRLGECAVNEGEGAACAKERMKEVLNYCAAAMSVCAARMLDRLH